MEIGDIYALHIFILFQEMRRRRAETSVELRKARKDENLQKRRNLVLSDEEDLASSDAENKTSVSFVLCLVPPVQ